MRTTITLTILALTLVAGTAQAQHSASTYHSRVTRHAMSCDHAYGPEPYKSLSTVAELGQARLAELQSASHARAYGRRS